MAGNFEFDRNRSRTPFDATVPEGVDPDALWRHSNSGRDRRVGSTRAERSGKVPGYIPGYGVKASPPSSATPKAEWDKMFTSFLPKPAAQPSGEPPSPVESTTPTPPAATPQQSTPSPGDASAQITPRSVQGVANPPAPHRGIVETGPNYVATQTKPTPTPQRGPGGIPIQSPDAIAAANAGIYAPGGMTATPKAPAAPPIVPRYAYDTTSVGTAKRIANLPPGQSASATFIPGQNTAANIKIRDSLTSKRPKIDPYAI